MLEIKPALTYSPEGVLTVQRGEVEVSTLPSHCGAAFRRNIGLELARSTATEWLADLPGVTVEEQDGTKTVSIPVAEALEDQIADPNPHGFNEVLEKIDVLMPSRPVGEVDRVLATSTIEPGLVRARVYHHFQRWLNQSGLTEGVALDCLVAMAVPFGRESAQEVEDNFSYSEHPDALLARSGLLEVIARQEDFGFERYGRRLWQTTKRIGSDEWEWVALVTHGDASMSPSWEDRQSIRVEPDLKSLYRMNASNVTSKQAFSLLLGLGSLAQHAADYSGEEDIFAGVSLGKAKRLPYPIPPVH